MNKATLVLLSLLMLCTAFADAQSLFVRHRDGTATAVPLSANPLVQTGDATMSVTSVSGTQSFDNDDVLGISFQTRRSDVNRDFHVDISDVVSVINDIADPVNEKPVSDVNADGKTDISDIVAIINDIAGTGQSGETESPSFAADRSSSVGDAIYVFRNDGEFNAFLRYEVESISFGRNMQVQTSDSTFMIPLAAIDSVSFIQPETVYRPNVILMDEEGQTSYIQSSEGMTVNFNSSLPKAKRPQTGDIIISSDFNNPMFEEGFIGKVRSSAVTDCGYQVVCDTVYEITDIYEKLVSVEIIEVADEESGAHPRKAKGKWNPDPSVVSFKLGVGKSLSDGKVSLSGSIKGTLKIVVEYNITLREQYINLRLGHDWSFGADLKFKAGKSFGTLFGTAVALPPIYFPAPTPLFKFQVSGCPFFKGSGDMSLDFSYNSPVHSYVSGFTYRNGSFRGFHQKNQNSAGNSPSFETELSLNGNLHTGVMVDFWLGTIKTLGSYIRTGLDFYIGPKLTGNFSVKAGTQTPVNYYSVYKDSKLDLSALSVDYEFFGEASLLGHKFPKAVFCNGSVKTPLHWEWFVFPKFSELQIVKDDKNMSAIVYTVPSRELLLPLSLGIGLYDEYGNVVDIQYEQNQYRSNNLSGVGGKFTNLEDRKTYKVCPVISLFGSNIPALPSSSFSIEKERLCPDDNHPHAIDLGIGVKWACCNVGASSPEQYGGYYAWGETEEKSYYDGSTYKYYNSSTGYQSLGSDIAGTQYDVAHVKWGSGWRMPSLDQIKTLINSCTSEWTSINGVYGRKVTGPNGGSIFLPAAGYRWYVDTYCVGHYGYYWSSTQYPDGSYYAYDLYFLSGSVDWDYDSRDDGQSVRPVTE